MPSCDIDLPDFAPRQINRAQSLGSFRITMEEVTPDGSTVTVTTAGEYICSDVICRVHEKNPGLL